MKIGNFLTDPEQLITDGAKKWKKQSEADNLLTSKTEFSYETTDHLHQSESVSQSEGVGRLPLFQFANGYSGANKPTATDAEDN